MVWNEDMKLKRRSFLQAIGLGSIGAGLVGVFKKFLPPFKPILYVDGEPITRIESYQVHPDLLSGDLFLDGQTSGMITNIEPPDSSEYQITKRDVDWSRCSLSRDECVQLNWPELERRLERSPRIVEPDGSDPEPFV